MASDNQPETTRRSLLMREARALRELPRLAVRSRDLMKAPRGNAAVMVIPGFSTNDTVMAPMRTFLKRRGHNVWGWGLGTNRGEVRRVLPGFIDEVERRYQQHGQPIVLVGWSLGGVFARETARRRPEMVSRVITMATPIHSIHHDPTSADRRIEQPITAFYSRHDGVVDWRNSIDDVNPDVVTIEVASSHLGITLDPTVWLETAARLAEHD